MGFALLLLLTPGLRVIDSAEARESADNILSQVYGAVTSNCYVDTNVDTFTTTSDAEAASGQKVVPLTATADLEATDWIVLDPAGAGTGPEACYIASVSGGISVTCTDNLSNTHASGITVNLTNRLPKTGSGFATGARVRLGCVTTAMSAGVPCEVKFGAATVDATYETGDIIPGAAGLADTRIYAIRGNGRFLSVLAADDTTVYACQMN